MTRRYADMNQHDALYKVARAYPGGLEALATKLDMSVNVLRNKLAPGIETHYPSFEELSKKEVQESVNQTIYLKFADMEKMNEAMKIFTDFASGNLVAIPADITALIAAF